MTLTRRAALLSAGTTALGAGLTVAASSAAEAAPAVPAPPTSYPLRLPDIQIRDPFIVPNVRTGHYYLYASNSSAASGRLGVGTMVYRSTNLRDWSTPQLVFQATPDLWATKGAWAPEVHRWNDRWYLFTTLHDPDQPLAQQPPGQYGLPAQIPQYARGTITAVSDSLMGPFTALDPAKPIAPDTFMTLDGTLFKDEKGKPWMVYAHEWVQKIDGTIEAIPLKHDLSAAAGKPIHLFKGSDATWISQEMPTPSANQILPYVTDGPQLYRLPGGALAMLWSTYEKNINNPNGMVTGHYVVTQAVSPSGRLKGPWVQKPPLLRADAGHGMIFRTLATKTRKSVPMLVAHKGTKAIHAKLFEIELRRDGLRLGKHRKDLDGTK
jgi:hypothetical protein